MAGTILGARDIAVNKIDTISVLTELILKDGGHATNNVWL